MFKGAISKVDESLGMLFGFALICTEEGEPYVDLHGEHVPEHSMMKASLRFMVGPRRAKLQHAEGEVYDGQVVFAYPLTSELAKEHGIKTSKTGLLIGLKPDNPATLVLARAGLLTGFSIGGRYVSVHEEEMEVKS